MQPQNPNHVHYRYDTWIAEDGRIYVRVEAEEFERATLDSFQLAGKRRIWMLAEKIGAPAGFGKGVGTTEVWDKALDYASDYPVAYVFRTKASLPADVLALHAALTSA